MVRKGKRGSWVIDFYYRDKAGKLKRYRRDSSSPTKKAAEQEEARIATNCALYGGPMAPAETLQDGAMTFASMVEEFRSGAAKVDLKASTRAGYEEILGTILVPRWGKTPIRDLDYACVQKLDGELKERDCSPSRRRNVQIVLRSVLHVAVDLGRMKDFPKLPALPKVGKTVVKVMRPEQVAAVIQKASDAATLPFALSAYCGLRACELRALMGRNIDFNGGWITVEESKSHGVIDVPKSGHQRKVPIPAPLLTLLRIARKKGKIQSDLPVCLNGDGEPWGESGLSQAFRRAARRAGVQGFSFHGLRHFYVTNMFRSGVSAPTVQAMAGHEHLGTTQRYAHAEEADARLAGEAYAARMGNLVGNIRETEPDNDT